MEFAIKILVVAVGGWVIWSVMQSRYAFKIRIRNAQPKITHGKVTANFLARLKNTCSEEGIQNGLVCGHMVGKQIRLTFSKQFSRPLQQRLRNEWPTLR
jgi:hypothetical protein